MHRTARVELRVTGGQRQRLFGLLRSGGDVWAAVLELNGWRRRRGDRPLAGYQELCRELAAAGEGTFGELSSVGARSVLRGYSDAWISAARRRRAGEASVRFPRRRRGLVPVRFYAGTFTIETDSGRPRVRLPVARGRPPLWVRLARPLPYPAERVRSVRLVHQGRWLFLDVTVEVPVATYPPGAGPDPARIAGVDLGIIHPFAVLASRGADGKRDAGLLVSGRALRAEHRLHLAEGKARARATAARAPRPGQRGSRRWRRYRARGRRLEGRHRRRLTQARHEAATEVVRWAVARRIGTLAVGDPRGLLARDAGRRQNKAVRDWAVGDLLHKLADKAEAAGIAVHPVDERGTSSTCPVCTRRVAKPRGRVFRCPHPGCGFTGHRDLVGAANIAARAPAPVGTASGGSLVTGSPPVTTHRRAGRHLPGAGRSRRDPRRGLLSRPPGRSTSTHPVARGGGSTWPAVARPENQPGSGKSLAGTRREDQAPPHRGKPCLTRH
ncbi:transposase [Blastococcus sp. BMG 814]|uniref:Transposase n=1 Tax=Blastococcus carthaginiensis TaxID=3050034 RepID=A0ABT9IIJ5_9ACTN|nr:transposase [Blastococcus carthaginiensis]MDP5183255.1 transposase [Blastococcus carthaginiensis]MDP5185098.1 transposase [Blastococcus carthaginiensis]MDP5185340.1 transposase [Blastococcus carthaginiensis]MDP5185408.1 transposase [Blastococcus carthaginiensis]